VSPSLAIVGASRCADCNEVRLPAVERCLACRSTDMVPCEVDGAGRILAVSRVHTPPRDGEPWQAVLAEVGGGVRIVGLGRPPIAVGDAAVVVADEDGVPVFAGNGAAHGG
jgi:uncharacterized OB-fold protein